MVLFPKLVQDMPFFFCKQILSNNEAKHQSCRGCQFWSSNVTLFCIPIKDCLLMCKEKTSCDDCMFLFSGKNYLYSGYQSKLLGGRSVGK